MVESFLRPVTQFNRVASIVLSDGKLGIDLSDFHYRFDIQAMDTESPNNMALRVFNLSDKTIARIKGEFSTVTVTAGYKGNTGVIFTGTIKQLRSGRESNISRYLDIFAADSDLELNYGIVRQTLAAGSKPQDAISAVSRAYGFTADPVQPAVNTEGVNPASLSRGKVLWGLGRSVLRDAAKTLNASWSVQGRQIQVLPMQAYLPNEVVELTSQTGLIGVPEQTDAGISARCLLNPRIVVGGLVKINNAAINHYLRGVKSVNPALDKDGIFGVAFNSWKEVQYGASVASDGIYRVLVVEYTGDNRGQDWYCNLVMLAANPSNKTDPVVAKN